MLKRCVTLLLAAAMLLSMTAVLAGCGTDQPGETNPGTSPVETTPSDETKTYTVQVKSAGGMALSGIAVYVYADDSLSDLKQYGETGENGQVSFPLAVGGDYAVVLAGVPEGYEVAASYGFTGTAANITLASSLITGEGLSGAVLSLGDVMYDFSVITPAGETVKLSELLKEKEAVLLNYWYTTCSACITEFPYMEQAYQLYKDKVEIVAINPFDDDGKIQKFQAEMGLSFPMAACQPGWANAFSVTGYPTSVMIDRYGVVCLIEVGALTSLRPFTSLFDHFTGDDYQQKLCAGGVADIMTNVKPTYTMASSEEIGAAVNSGDIQVAYRPEEGESAEYSWPFIIDELGGSKVLKASNQGIDDSFAILYADVQLKAGQAIGFDYLSSTEQASDVLFVIVDDEDIYQISGVSGEDGWKSCYPWVAEEDGTYELALCYLKDEGDSAGDDTVYIKNMRVVEAAEIDTVSYIPRLAATSVDGFEYRYVEVFYNQQDGYYHVGSENGPLLLANLLGYTQFSEEQSMWLYVYDNGLTVDGVDYAPQAEEYSNYASNASLNGYCPVTEELAKVLQAYDKMAGFDEADDREWLRLCSYYQVYGSGDAQLIDPIKGLSTFSAYEAKLGKNVETNYFYYDRIIMPRGLLAKFVPEKSGVYRITSRNESTNGVDGWIFDENHQQLMVYEQSERMFADSGEVSMVYYMEAGKPYFIDIAFWDPYEVGYIYYDIEYLGKELDLFRLCSPGYFTYDADATGDTMYYVIAGGIKAVLGTDGKYYEDLGKDANGKQRYGSLIYADFTGVTSLFSAPIATVEAYNADGSLKLDTNGNPVMVSGMIDLGGFDFSKTEEDLYVLGLMKKHDNDVAATDAYLRELWGEEYDGYAEIYQLKDVYAGRFHGEGPDLTEEMRTYLDDIITTGSSERQGCVVLTERLAEILQLLMDKYTFKGVEQSWLKLCYFYDHLGPEG